MFLWDVLQRTLKKDLPLSPFGIRYLPCVEPEGVPSDMFMVMCMHSVWRTRMDVRHAHLSPRSARDYFIEAVIYIRDVYKALDDPPEWITVFDHLATIRPF